MRRPRLDPAGTLKRAADLSEKSSMQSDTSAGEHWALNPF